MNDWENVIAYWEDTEQSDGEQMRFAPNTFGGFGGRCYPRKILLFFTLI